MIISSDTFIAFKSMRCS